MGEWDAVGRCMDYGRDERWLLVYIFLYSVQNPGFCALERIFIGYACDSNKLVEICRGTGHYIQFRGPASLQISLALCQADIAYKA